MKIEFRLDAQGIGDAVCGVYAACGLANRGHVVNFYTKHWEFLQSFKNINLTIRGEDPSVFNANAGYKDQLHASRMQTCRSRASWYLRNIQNQHATIKNEVKPALPGELLPAEQAEDLPDQYVLLAPFSAYQDREWSSQHWRILAKALMDEGYNVIAMSSNKDSGRLRETFTKTGVRYFWGQTPKWVVNAIRGSLILIGNDSGPAHLAGLHKHPAIAIAGQIDADFVFRDSPSVHTMMPPKSVPCRLCHWELEAGYHWMCNTGCSALQLISPFEVVDKAISLIKGETIESVSDQTRGRQVDISREGVPGIQQADQSPGGERQEESRPSEEGGRSEDGELWASRIPRFHTAQGPGASEELPGQIGGDQGQVRKSYKKRRVQSELLGA